MVYIVMEIQSTETTAATIVTTYTDRNTAEQAYHTILAAASVSPVPIHSAVMLTNDGTRIKGETYRHDSQPVPAE